MRPKQSLTENLGVKLIALVVAIVTEGDDTIVDLADDVYRIPEVDPMFTPFLVTIPLQLLAYHIATLRGTDVDQPRNLAKSVTVE